MEQCPVDRSIVSVCPLQELFHPHVAAFISLVRSHIKRMAALGPEGLFLIASKLWPYLYIHFRHSGDQPDGTETSRDTRR